MEKNGVWAVFLTVLFVADVANASLFYRKLAEEAPKNNSSSTPVPPSPSPISAGNNLDPKATVHNKSNDQDPKKVPVPDNNSTKLDPSRSNTTDSATPAPQHQSDNTKGSSKTDPAVPPHQNLTDNQNGNNEKGSSKAPPQAKRDNGSSKTDSVSQPAQQKKGSSNKDSETPPPSNTRDDGISTKKNDDKMKPQMDSLQNCSGMPNRCRDEKNLVACIQTPQSGSTVRMVLIQNEGDTPLKVNIVVPAIKKYLELEIPKHHTERVNTSLVGDKSNKLIINAGHGDCVLHINALVSEGNYFLRLPSYEKLVTPINGAYFLIFTVVVFGGTWACCKFGKRRRQEGVPYQELEMGLPDSFLANDLETAEGWDQGWDDDWNEENAVKSLGGQHARNISANGLSSRSSNRDGWENDWDD